MKDRERERERERCVCVRACIYIYIHAYMYVPPPPHRTYLSFCGGGLRFNESMPGGGSRLKAFDV